MKIHVLISWYDERPDWLAATVASCAKFADTVVAVDGAYALYPDGKGQSPTGQAEAIRETARALGMGVTICEPALPWRGNEVEKRAAMFRVAETVSEPRDWYFIMDGDQVVREVRCDLKEQLAFTDLCVAESGFWTRRQHYAPEDRPFVTSMDEFQGAIRTMFRAIPGLTVEGTHFNYVCPDGRTLWSNGPGQERALDLRDEVLIEHRNQARDLWRNQSREKYYERRNSLNIEGVF